MKIDQSVKITKVDTLNPGNYRNGYWLKGMLTCNIEVGKRITAYRTSRAAQNEGETEPVEREGIFTSSRVMEIEGNRVTTENSIYTIDIEPNVEDFTVSPEIVEKMDNVYMVNKK